MINSNNLKGVICVGAGVGGNIGEYVGLGIKNIALFEPNMDNYRKLVEVVDEADGFCGLGLDFKLMPLALGNCNGQIAMLNDGLNSSFYYECLLDHQNINPKIKKLDSLSFNFQDYDFLDLDCCGYELEVLKGAYSLLQRKDCIKIIRCKANRKNIKDWGKIEQVVEFLKSNNMNFKLKDIDNKGFAIFQKGN